MEPLALVINAGSSTLEFCILRNHEPQSWHGEQRRISEASAWRGIELDADANRRASRIARHTGSVLGLVARV